MSTVKIQAKDGRPHEIETEAVKYSETIKEMFDVIKIVGPDEVISVPEVPDYILIQIIEWLNYCHYKISPVKTLEIDQDLEDWKSRFLEQNNKILVELLNAAHYFKIKTLLETLSGRLAKIISGKSPNDIRLEFGISDDLTREQKEEIRRENEFYGIRRL